LPEPIRVSADAGLTLESAKGRVTLCSGEGIDLFGARSVEVATDTVRVEARDATVVIDDLGFFGKMMRAHVSKVRLVADELDQALGRFSQRAERAYRFVAELDQLRAGSIDVRAETVATIRAENTLLSARVLTKIDAQQVNIG